MSTLSKFNPIARAVGVIGVVAGLVTGVTFAALNSTATLTNTTISSATASLKLWDGDSYESTAPGFTITDLVPGTGSENAFYFQNASAVDLDVTASVPGAPSATGFTGWDKLKVTFTSDNPLCEDNKVDTTMEALLAGEVELPCNALTGNATGNSGVEATEGNYKVKFDINPSDVEGDSISVGAFNIDFTGTQATVVEE